MCRSSLLAVLHACSQLSVSLAARFDSSENKYKPQGESHYGELSAYSWLPTHIGVGRSFTLWGRDLADLELANCKDICACSLCTKLFLGVVTC